MNTSDTDSTAPDLDGLARQVPAWARALGFRDAAISDADPAEHARHLDDWLAQGCHGEMAYMADHRQLRADPALLLPGVRRVISVVMDYLSDDEPMRTLRQPEKAYIARYALGRDYHKLMRKRLAQLARRLEAAAGGHYRAFVDSAPVLERGFAQRAGLGWIGKNTMLLNRGAGSWFFLGEIYTDLPLPVSPASAGGHCGSCRACLDICPTDAFIGPYRLDARRCIAYLTIEHRGPIPADLRPLLGNRIFGCDDCQLACPWNRFARRATLDDFQPRHGLADSDLVQLFAWSEQEFLERTAGSAIRRTGYQGWLRNIAVALGNAPRSAAVAKALHSRADDPSALVREHVAWALQRQRDTSTGPVPQ